MTHPNSNGQVLIFSGVLGDTRRYRTLHLYEQLKLSGVNCVLSHLMDPHLPDLAQSASAVILHRVAFDRYVEKLFGIFHKRNALVILDADDFLYDPSIMQWIDSPDFKDPVRAALYRRELLRHRQTLEQCDAVTVSTDALDRMMAPFGKPVRIHRNAFSLEMLALSNQASQARTSTSGKIIVGYASGTRTHDKDFAFIQPALRAAMERHPEVELWLMGALTPNTDWDNLQDRIKRFPLVPWRELPGRLAQLDINLAPLIPNSPFNQAKSEIKFMEAALVRVPTIASRTDAFEYGIRDGETGMLAGRPEDWESALEFLITHPPARQALGQAAYQDVWARYSPCVRGREAGRILLDLAAEAGKTGLEIPPAPSCDANLLSRYFFSREDEAHPTTRERAFYSIRHRGISTLLGQVWVYFRRKLEPIFPF